MRPSPSVLLLLLLMLVSAKGESLLEESAKLGEREGEVAEYSCCQHEAEYWRCHYR